MAQEKRSGEVEKFIEELEHPHIDLIRELREHILGSNEEITEQIKWNAPSFCYGGDDRVTMKLYPPRIVQLIFHRGAKTKEMPPKKLIKDDTGLLKWVTNDRAVATFTDLKEYRSKSDDVVGLVSKWIEAARD